MKIPVRSDKPLQTDSVLDFWSAQQADFFVCRDYSIDVFSGVTGDSEFRLEGEHAFALAPTPGITIPTSQNGSRVQDHLWPQDSIGYLPPGLKLFSTILDPMSTAFVRVNDAIFRKAAYETVDPDRIDYRYMYGVFDSVAVNLVRSMAELSRQDDTANWPLLVDSMATALAIRGMRALGAEPLRGDVPYPQGLSPQRLRRVVDFVESNIHRPIRLAELADIAALSPYHFARSFRSAMKMAPVRYVWKRRVDRAKDLLRDHSLSLAHVAYACGFSSQSHFTTLFKQITGVTPAAYRMRS